MTPEQRQDFLKFVDFKKPYVGRMALIIGHHHYINGTEIEVLKIINEQFDINLDLEDIKLLYNSDDKEMALMLIEYGKDI